MARANLNISQELNSAFNSANDAQSTIRALKVSINNEDIVLSTTLSISGTSEDDFNTKLPPLLTESDACLIIYRLADTASDHSRKWLLIAWVPDGCRVRDKMLYSSSREDLKKALGLSQFTSSDYATNSLSDITWNMYMNSTLVHNQDEMLTAKERSLIEEDALAHMERIQLGTKTTAMGAVPFTLSPEVVTAFQKFNQRGVCNWIEMSVVSEVIKLEKMSLVKVTDHLESLVNATAARFILARFPNFEDKLLTFFIYSCPENIPIREKMTMSTSKATVITSAVIDGITVDKTIEIHGPDEVTYAIQHELTAPVELSAASASATLSHSKPQRPGKGKSVVKKFQADAAED